MIIRRIILAQTPFDSNYDNVPSYPYGGRDAANYLQNMLVHSEMLGTTLNVNGGYITTKAFTNNEDETVRVKVIDPVNGPSYREFNYMFIYTEDNLIAPHCYFITNIVALNALTEPTYEFTLKLDVWTTYYNQAYREGQRTLVTRCHTKMTFNDSGTFRSDYQNLYDGEIGTLVKEQYWGNRILWAVFKCDPTINYFEWESANTYTNIGHYGPDDSYGTYQYFYYPVAAIVQGKLHKVRCGHRNSVYIPKVHTTVLLSLQLTVHVPFVYSLNWDDEGKTYYVGTPELIARPIHYTYASGKYYNIDANDSSDPETEEESTYFFTYHKDSDRTVNETVYTFNCRYENLTYYGVTSPRNSPYCQAYPFKYYTLTLPNGKTITFNQAGPLTLMKITIIPTDSGGSYSVYAENNDTVLLARDGVWANFEVTGDVPRSVSAYLEFMRRSGDTMIAQKNYEQRSLIANAETQVLSGVAETVAGAATMVATGGTMGVGTTVRGATSLISTGINTVNDAVYFKEKWSARESDLSKSTVTSFQPANQLNSAPHWGMPIVTEHTPLATEATIAIVGEFVRNGTECQLYADPLEENRKYFNYSQAPNVTYTSIHNPRYRQIFESIVRKGVRKWNVVNYTGKTLDYYTINNEETD